jgi:hypothetical protein
MSAPVLPRRAGDVETALRDIRDRRRHDEGDRKREKCRQRLQRGADYAEERHDAGHRRGQHGADAHRIDVVEMGALEFDPGRAETERLVDGEVRHQRADPGDRHDGVKPKDVLEHLEDAELHQHQRDRNIEDEPHHTARMAVGEAREEIRPRDRTGIGVGDVDLDLRNDDESAGERERELRR